MVSWFMFMFWAGGWGPVYARHRGKGQGRLTSAFDAICWPGGLGRFIALKFYYEW